MPAEILIYPRNIFGDRTKKGSLSVSGPPLVKLVENGKVVLWDGYTVWVALTASESDQNKNRFPKRLLRDYRKKIFNAAKSKDPQKIRMCIRTFPEVVVQPNELLNLDDCVLLEGARFLTEAI